LRKLAWLPLGLGLAVLAPGAWAQEALINSYTALSPHIQKARTAFLKDRLDRCEAEARFCLERLPEHHAAHFLMAEISYKRAEYGAALEHLQAAEAGFIRIAGALRLAGRQGAQSQSEDMLRVIDEIADLAGSWAAARGHGNGTADIYDRALQDSRQEMLKAEGERSKSDAQGGPAIPALYRYWHGNVLFMLKRPAEAEAQYRQAIGTDPDFRDAYNNLINLLYVDGRVDEAREVLAQAEAHKAKVHPELKKAILGHENGPNG
jgi:tetratricopeptide (TPR) repeat protein